MTKPEAINDRSRNQNGYAIRAFRQLLGISADDLAKELLVSTPAIWAYENEHRNCPPAQLAKIAKALHVDVRAISRDLVLGAAA